MSRFEDCDSLFHSENTGTVLTGDESTSIESFSTMTPSMSHLSYMDYGVTSRSTRSGNDSHFSSVNGLTTASELFSETLNDTRDVIELVMKNANAPPFSLKKRATIITTNMNGAAMKIKRTLEKGPRERERKMKERLKRLEEDKQMEIQKELAMSREECAAVAKLWRQGY